VANLSQSQVQYVHLGDPAEIHVTGIDANYQGKLSAILPDVDGTTRTVKARIELANPQGVLKPGMFVGVTLKVASNASVLVVPEESIIATGTRNVVIVADDSGRYQPVEVTLGRQGNGEVEVTSGLTKGQKIVVSGQFLLDSEASLKTGLARLETGAVPDKVSAPSAATSVVYYGQGRVEAIHEHSVTISHEAIASLHWDAMTMDFKDPPQGIPKDVKVGSQVHFEFIATGTDYVLQGIGTTGVQQ
jgi:Cu(I)/Ag(I) efflux system membrane fusion protein